MQSDDGLKRPLHRGDEVILTTGATATVRAEYPQGYSGEVAILLDGVEEMERASGLTLQDKPPIEAAPEFGDAAAPQEGESGNARAPSRRMED